MSERGAFRGRGAGRGGDRGGRGGARGGGAGGGGGAHAGGQTERPKKENILDLSKYMDKQITVKFSGGREGEACIGCKEAAGANIPRSHWHIEGLRPAHEPRPRRSQRGPYRYAGNPFSTSGHR
jgi:hypothetical protein